MHVKIYPRVSLVKYLSSHWTQPSSKTLILFSRLRGREVNQAEKVTENIGGRVGGVKM